jgi:hypothetical protein
MKYKHDIFKYTLTFFILIILLSIGDLGQSSLANERMTALLGEWKGTCSFSVGENGFTPLKATILLHVSEQSDRRFKCNIEGYIDGVPYRSSLAGEIDEHHKNIYAIDNNGIIYTGYFVTNHIIRLYSFEKKSKTRIIQYRLKKLPDT